MPDAPDVQPLSDADLLAWAIVLTHRARQERDGIKYVLQTYPPCPTCGEAVDAAWQVTTDRPDRLLRDIRLTVKPCGHVHTASEDRVHRLWSDIHEMVADVSDSYDGRVGQNRRWTTKGIVHEAQARTARGEGAPEPQSDAAQVRPDPRQPAYDAVYENIRSLGEYLPPDTVHRNAIIWRAVQAALDATPVGRCMSSHCVEGDHFIGLGGSDA
ncbi:hypothetical protein [Streptomyces sp. CFMR 7]|uniref:hypothetical protein n=1 Tax=Streptomyces sp. CFMR 7 TaxID=1649184 RepID=UPI00119FE2C3|nr:hypothetical protein [Streptomyces sp. CFMR 7]